jgi:hypothetical protein
MLKFSTIGRRFPYSFDNRALHVKGGLRGVRRAREIIALFRGELKFHDRRDREMTIRWMSEVPS